MSATLPKRTKGRRFGRLVQVVIVILLLELSLAYLVLGSYRTLTGPGGNLNQGGNPLGSDFVQYYAVSVMALDDQPEAAYELAKLHEVEQRVVDSDVERWPWYYPPTFMLVVRPLSLVPYPVALALWLLASVIPFLVVIYRIAPHPLAPFAALLFPATADVLFSGQNGCLSAALIGGGLLLLERRPVVAGLLIGLLSYKPHLGLIIPFALAAGGHWRAFLAAALTTLAFAGASLAAFGPDTWLAFVSTLSDARSTVEFGESPWFKMVSVFPAARLLGFGVSVAWIAQGVIAVAAAGAVVWLWRRPAAPELRASALIFAIPLVTPYAQFYDLALLALPIAWIIWRARASGWLRGERLAMAVLWPAPVLAWSLAQEAGIPTWPLLLSALLALVLRRAAREAHADAAAPPLDAAASG